MITNMWSDEQIRKYREKHPVKVRKTDDRPLPPMWESMQMHVFEAGEKKRLSLHRSSMSKSSATVGRTKVRHSKYFSYR